MSTPAEAKVVSSTMEGLSKAAEDMLSNVLPDISQFNATDDIERGIAISSAAAGRCARRGLARFALPMGVLAVRLPEEQGGRSLNRGRKAIVATLIIALLASAGRAAQYGQWQRRSDAVLGQSNVASSGSSLTST